MTKIIAVSNQKGGCGKTTTTISLASALAMRGYTCTVVDCDPQTNASQGLGVEPEEDLTDDQYTVIDAYLGKKPGDQIEISIPGSQEGRLFLMPGSRGISTVQFQYDADVNKEIASGEITHIDADNLKDEQRRRLATSLKPLRGKRDFIFIDTGPELGFVMMTALIAADCYIIPMVPSGYDIKGLKKLVKTASQIRQKYQPALTLLGVLLTKIQKGTKLDVEIRDLLLNVFDDGTLFDIEITTSVRHREASLHGIPIHDHAPDEPASTQYLSLADEVLERLGNPKPIVVEDEKLSTPVVNIADSLKVPKPANASDKTTKAVGQGGE